jgi:hypothetical protein
VKESLITVSRNSNDKSRAERLTAMAAPTALAFWPIERCMVPCMNPSN